VSFETEFRQAYGRLGDAERRTFAGPSKVAPNREGDRINVVGHAATFDSPSVEMASPRGRFVEYIDRRAFANVLRANPDVQFNWDHDTSRVMASTSAGNLELRTSEIGLRYYASVNPTLSYAKDLRTLMQEGVVAGSSFTFIVAPGGEEWNSRGGTITRRITDIGELLDVCVTAAPAYPASDAALARSAFLTYARSRGFLRSRELDAFRAQLELRRRRLSV